MTTEPPAPLRAVRLLRHIQGDDGSFDLEFWQRVGPEGRFAAAWEMAQEVAAMRGEDVKAERLQKSVLRLLRR